MARKGHVGYYSGRPVAPFPRVQSPGELAAYCREHGVRWIYYSWYEALLRPELMYLLDTTATVPGLTLVHSAEQRPCRVFRVDPGFGEAPAWWDDVTQRGIHIARGAVQVLEETRSWEHHLLLAYDAASREDAWSMLEHADAALRGRPGEAHAWALRGAALQAQSRAFEAIDAYRTALRLQPGMRLAEDGLRRLRGTRHTSVPPVRPAPPPSGGVTRFSARRRRRRSGRCSPPRRTLRAT
jgi:tetratricopeptide (TPR) repeat protein